MSKNTISKARKSPLKVVFQGTKEKLTSQAGLIPVVKFLDKIGLSKVVESTVEHLRGENAVYELPDVVNLTTVGIVGGARYLTGVVSVWSDRVLRQLGGWLRIPDDTTLSRIFKRVSRRFVRKCTLKNNIKDLQQVSKNEPYLTIPFLLFAQKPRRYCKVGFVAAVPIQVTV